MGKYGDQGEILRIVVRPSDLSGEVRAPSSKSHTHRAFFAALLSSGRSRIEGALRSGDTKRTLDAVRSFGSKSSWDVVEGADPLRPAHVFSGRSGTTRRIACAVASLIDGRSIIMCDPLAKRRPIAPLLEALRSLGARVSLNPLTVEGPIEGGSVTIDCSLSSQFLTALLIIAPLVGMTIKVENLVSKSYVETTLEVLRCFGVSISGKDLVFEIPLQSYVPSIYRVPGDFSSASFLLAAGALCGKVRVENLSFKHPDARIVDVLERMGARVRRGDRWVEVESSGELEGVEVNLSSSPDLLPILAVLGAFASGITVLRGVGHTRYKESDRIRSMSLNLRRAGIEVRELYDGLVVRGGSPRGSHFLSSGDHRVEMAMVILGLAAEGESSVEGVFYMDSYPGFLSDLRSLGGSVCLV